MKRMFNLICLCFAFHNATAQEVETVLSGASPFKNGFFSTFFSDVYTYFEPDYDYSTPLKKNVFESTPEYKSLADSLKRIKADLLKPHYLKIKVDKDVEYDMKKAGIRVLMSSRFNRREVQGTFNVYEQDPSADSKFYLAFTNLPLTPEMVYPQLPDLAQREEHLFIPLNKQIGMEFENSSSQELYIIFQPTNKSKNTKVQHLVYKDYYDSKYVYVIAKKIILLIDGKVVYTKSM